MELVKIGQISDWRVLEPGEVIRFPGDASGRRVELDLCCARGAVLVLSGDGEDAPLEVGVSPGLSRVAFSAVEPVNVFCAERLHVRTFDRSQRLEDDGMESFTRIAPRVRGASDEFRRLSLLAEYHSRRREAALMAQFEEKLAALSAVKADEPLAVKADQPLVEDPEGKPDGA